MTQKVIEVFGTSKQSFAKAAESAVKEAAKTVRAIKWAHVDSFDMLLDDSHWNFSGDGKKLLDGYIAAVKARQARAPAGQK